MGIFKRGGKYWYKFRFNCVPVVETTKQSNADVARTIEAAHRNKLALEEVGIRKKQRVPTLREFQPRFDAFIQSERQKNQKDKGNTLKFYRERMKRLLEYPALADCPLDAMTVEMIGAFKRARSRQITRLGRAPSASSINGELRTLKRLMRVACDWKIISWVPKIQLVSGENQREFVLSYRQERDYLQTAPQPLADIALLILEEGMRLGEAADLELANVHLDPAQNAALGYVHIARGKTKNSKRNLSLTGPAREMLIRRSKAAARGARYVFPNPETGGPYRVSSLDHDHAEVRAVLMDSGRIRRWNSRCPESS